MQGGVSAGGEGGHGGAAGVEEPAHAARALSAAPGSHPARTRPGRGRVRCRNGSDARGAV